MNCSPSPHYDFNKCSLNCPLIQTLLFCLSMHLKEFDILMFYGEQIYVCVLWVISFPMFYIKKIV